MTKTGTEINEKKKIVKIIMPKLISGKKKKSTERYTHSWIDRGKEREHRLAASGKRGQHRPPTGTEKMRIYCKQLHASY